MNWPLLSRTLIVLVLASSGASAQQSAAPPNNGMPTTMTPVGLGYGAAVPPVAPNPLEDPSFNSAISGQFPLTPGQITDAKRLRAQVDRALATPGGEAAKPDIRTITVGLSPGSPPPVINLEEGNITTLIFEDQTGAPWPVTGVFVAPDAGLSATIIGNDLVKDASGQGASTAPNLASASLGQPSVTPASVAENSQVTEELSRVSSNIVALNPTSTAIVGKDLVVTLQGYNLPVIFTFQAGGSEVDYRTNVMVPSDGPNAVHLERKPEMPSIEMDGIQAFVDGVPPASAKKLDVSDPAIDAWYYKGKIFVRTTDNMASPSDYSRMSPTGETVYVLDPQPIFDVFYNGALEQVQVSSLPPAYDYASATPQQDFAK
jgi:intracellular multiplication protein IcmK